MAFGGFVSATFCHSLYLQRHKSEPTRFEEFLVKVAQYVSDVELAIATKLQMGANYHEYWVTAIAIVIVVTVLPILCDLLISLDRFGRRTKLLILYDIILRIDWLWGKIKDAYHPLHTMKCGILRSMAACIKAMLRQEHWEEEEEHDKDSM